MRWFPFILLAIAGIVCQTTLVAAIRAHGVGPNVMFILAVYYALWGPWPDAALAAMALGFMTDLYTGSPGRIGLHAFCYGGVAWCIIQVRQVLVRTHPLAQVLIVLAFGGAVELAVALYHYWIASQSGLAKALGLAVLSAAYTAVLTPVLLWLLCRLGRLTGLTTDPRAGVNRRR